MFSHMEELVGAEQNRAVEPARRGICFALSLHTVAAPWTRWMRLSDTSPIVSKRQGSTFLEGH